MRFALKSTRVWAPRRPACLERGKGGGGQAMNLARPTKNPQLNESGCREPFKVLELRDDSS